MYTPLNGNYYPVGVILRGAKTQNPPTNIASGGARNTLGVGSQFDQYVAFEDYQQVIGAHRKYLPTCDVIKNTSVVRSGGASASMECIPLSNCAANAPALLAEWTEVVAAGTGISRSVYVRGEAWSSFPTNAQLYIQAEHYSDGTLPTKSTVKSTEVISANDTWTELSVTFDQAQTGPVRYQIWLATYESGTTRKVYVDSMLVTPS